MLVLGIESATPVASVALADEKGLLGEVMLNVGLTHSEQLLPMIDGLLRQCRLAIGDVTAIGVSAGPGSFTGLRIGMATAKALAQGLSCKPDADAAGSGGRVRVLAVPTLEAMAWALIGQGGWVSPMLNARREQIYAGLYHWRAEGAGEPAGEAQSASRRGKKERVPAGAGGVRRVLECLIPPEAASPDAWAGRIRECLGAAAGGSAPKADEAVYLLGEGAEMYKEAWRAGLGEKARILPPVSGLSRGGFVALAAMGALPCGGAREGWGERGLQDFYNMKPVYLRGI